MNKKIAKLVNDAGKLEQDIKAAEETLGRMRAKLSLIQIRDLPEAMQEVGLAYIETDYYSCDLTLAVNGSLPKDEEKRAEAIDYLRELDAEDLLKSEVSVSFGKGDDATARRMARILKQHTNQEVKVETTVHPSTLAAWGRERIKTNKPIDAEKVGLFIRNVAKIKQKKD